jgi:hypothetical protein
MASRIDAAVNHRRDFRIMTRSLLTSCLIRRIIVSPLSSLLTPRNAAPLDLCLIAIIEDSANFSHYFGFRKTRLDRI